MFNALLLEKKDDVFSARIAELDEASLPAGMYW